MRESTFDRKLAAPPPGQRIMIATEATLHRDYPNGVQRCTDEVVKFLRESGHEIRIIAPEPAAAGDLPEQYSGVSGVTLPSMVLSGHNVAMPTRKNLRITIKEYNPDGMYFASPAGLLGRYGTKITYKLGIPTIANYQTNLIKYVQDRRLKLLGSGAFDAFDENMRKIHDRADLTLAPSQDAISQLADFGIDLDRVRLWRRGVDADQFNPRWRDDPMTQSLRRAWSPDGRPIVGVVSRLEHEKSLHDFRHLVDLDVALVMIGDGSARLDLERMFGDRVIFAGRQSGDNLARHYAALDIFCAPSQSETFGQTIQEAGATGLPVVAAAAGGHLDTVRHGQTGYLYDPSAVDSHLADWVRYLAYDVEERERMGSEARHLMERRTWQELGREFLDHYVTAQGLNKSRR